MTAVTGFKRSATTDEAGQFVFRNLAPNPYHLAINAQGFAPMARDVDVRSAVPIDVPITLALAGQSTSVEVVGTGEMVERDPSAHTDIDLVADSRDLDELRAVLAGVAAITIALLTVSVQAIRAATANPVNSLRSE